MEKDFKKKGINPLCIYTLAFSMLLPSLTGVVEAASDNKVSNTEKIVASQKEKIEGKKKEVQEEKTKPEAKEELEDILTQEEIQEIKTRANNLENSYFFNGNMLEELKAELRKAKANPTVNYQEAKVRLINKAIIKNTPAQKAPEDDRAVKKFEIVNPKNLKSGDDKITVRGNAVEKGHTIEVLVNNVKKGSLTIKRTSSSYKITLDEPLKENDKVKAVLKDKDGNTTLASTQVYNTKESDADKYKNDLKMPSGEILIEQYVANIASEDEKAEALDI